MDPITILAIANGAVGILEKLAPAIKTAFSSGEISLDDQKALKDRIDAIMGSDAFSGPEWEQG